MFSRGTIEHLRWSWEFHTAKKLTFGLLDAFWVNCTRESLCSQETMSKSSLSSSWKCAECSRKEWLTKVGRRITTLTLTTLHFWSRIRNMASYAFLKVDRLKRRYPLTTLCSLTSCNRVWFLTQRWDQVRLRQWSILGSDLTSVTYTQIKMLAIARDLPKEDSKAMTFHSHLNLTYRMVATSPCEDRTNSRRHQSLWVSTNRSTFRTIC